MTQKKCTNILHIGLVMLGCFLLMCGILCIYSPSVIVQAKSGGGRTPSRRIGDPADPITIEMDISTVQYDRDGNYSFAPYYMDGSTRVPVDYTLPTISGIGDYLLHVEDIAGHTISNQDIDIHIIAKEITATYENLQVAYNRNPQTVVATTPYEYISISIDDPTHTYPGSYPIHATMQVDGVVNNNYVLVNRDVTMIISKGTINESQYTTHDVTVRYLDDINNLDNLDFVTTTAEDNIVYWIISRYTSDVTVGTYDVEISFHIIQSERSYYNPFTYDFSIQTVHLIILPKILHISDYTFDNNTIVYDGNDHAELVILAQGHIRYNIEDKDGNIIQENMSTYSLVNVDNYTITVNMYIDDDNYILDEYSFTRTISITPADYNQDLLPVYVDEYVVYDSLEHRYDLTPYTLPTGVSISTAGYEYYIHAGDYPITITYDLGINYNPLPSLTRYLRITPKPITAILDVDTFSYNTEPHTITAHAIGLCDGDTGVITLAGNIETDEGRYDATIIGIDNPDYHVSTETLPFTILPTYPSLNSLVFVNQTFVYDGERHLPTFSIDLPTGVSARVVSMANCTHVGRHLTYLVFTSENHNYLAPNSLYAYTIIEPKPVTITFGNSTFIYTGTEKSVDYSISGVLDGDTCGSSIEYNGTLIAPGDYLGIVRLDTPTDYVISGDDSIIVTILATHKAVASGDYAFDLKGDSFRIDMPVNIIVADAEYVDYFEKGECVRCSTLDISIGVDDTYTLSLAPNDTYTSFNNVSVYRINANGSLTMLEKSVWGDKIHFEVHDGDKILMVEYKPNSILPAVLIIASILIVSLLVALPYIWENRRLSKMLKNKQ